MRRDAPRVGAATDEAFLVFALGLTVVAAVLLMAVVELGSWFTDGVWLANPVAALWAVLLGDRAWAAGHTAVAVLLGLPTLLVLVYWQFRSAKRATSVDRKAKHMGSARAHTVAASAKRAEAGRLIGTGITIQPGLLYGRAVRGGAELYTDWRDTVFVEMGPGTGKTSSVAIPFVVAAPGNVLTTSNKRDLADAVRGPCEARGTYWGFDPMRIANHHHGARPAWWWNPLQAIRTPAEAKALADIFVDAIMPADAVKHPYFDTKGPTLLANLLLAAALSDQQLPRVYEWLNDLDDREAVQILRRAGLHLPARFLIAAYGAAFEERSGLFGTAANALEFLVDPGILEWITNGDGEDRPEFDPAEFVKPFNPDGSIKRDTLLALSRDGDGTAVALTTALIVAVTKAAEREATRYEHGRLPVPLVAALDEIANTVPWRKLPKQYSFYGSSGLTLIAMIQSWAQAVEAWKRTGADQLWNASTIRLVGGGLADATHLADISKLIGQRWVSRRTGSIGRNHSLSSTPEREDIMSVDEISALNDGRFVLVPAGGFAVLGRLVPHWERPEMAEAVKASIAKYEPKDERPAAVDAA